MHCSFVSLTLVMQNFGWTQHPVKLKKSNIYQDSHYFLLYITMLTFKFQRILTCRSYQKGVMPFWNEVVNNRPTNNLNTSFFSFCNLCCVYKAHFQQQRFYKNYIRFTWHCLMHLWRNKPLSSSPSFLKSENSCCRFFPPSFPSAMFVVLLDHIENEADLLSQKNSRLITFRLFPLGRYSWFEHPSPRRSNYHSWIFILKIIRKKLFLSISCVWIWKP